MINSILNLTVKDLLGYAVFGTGLYFLAFYAWAQIEPLI